MFLTGYFTNYQKARRRAGPLRAGHAARFLCGLLDGYIAHEHNRQLRPGRFAAGLEG